MRIVIDKPFHQIGNTVAVNLNNGTGSANVTVPFPKDPEYPGTLRCYFPAPGTSLAFVKVSNAANPTAAATDICVPGGVLCFFELEQDTVSIGCFSTASAQLQVAVGSGGI